MGSRAPKQAEAPNGASKALNLAQAVSVIGAQQRARPPRILHQYWDNDPPRQVQKLLRHCGKVAAAAGVSHRVWNDTEARALLADGFPDVVAEAYDIAPHASMKSDVFRLAVLQRHGGVYLDADMVLRKERGADLWASFTEALVFKWNLENRTNTPTWCLGFRKGHPMVAAALHHVAGKMVIAVKEDPEKALKNALGLGPGSLTEAIGTWLQTHGGEGVTVLDVQDAYKLVQNGPAFLGRGLAYKDTGLHWLVAGRSGSR